MSEIIQVESALSFSQSHNAFNTLFLSYEQELQPKTLEQKVKFIAALIRAIEECESQSENSSNVNTWLSISSGIGATAIIISSGLLTPLAAGLALSVSILGSGATIAGTIFKQTKENPILNCLKRYRLCLKSTKTADWAATWQLVGTERFLDALYEGSTGQVIENKLIRSIPSLNSVLEYLASLQGCELGELISEIKLIKSGKQVVQQWVNESLSDPGLEPLPPSGNTVEPFIDTSGLNKTALAVRDSLVINASSSTLPGCVILAAPGSGKTTFLGSAWLKLKEKYSTSFKSLAIIVKPEDKATFERISDKVLNAKTQSRTAAIALIKFVAEGMHQDEIIRRLFIDDFLTASKYLNAAVKGYQINLESYATYPSKKEASEAKDFDTISLKDAYESALNEAWLVGREYNLCLWISSHSSNIEDLSFMGGSSSRSVGDFIFLARDGKRDFLETALKNDFLIPSSTTRAEIKHKLESLKVDTDEPILLANYNNWVLGVVPQSVRTEYESLLSNQSSAPQKTVIQNSTPTLIQDNSKTILQEEDTGIAIGSDELNRELQAKKIGISLDAFRVLEKLDRFNGELFTPSSVAQQKPFGKKGDNSSSKIKYFLDELVIANLLIRDGEKYKTPDS